MPNQGAYAQQPHRVWTGFILTELILKINDLGIDPEKADLFVLAVDQLKRNLEYKFDGDFLQTLTRIHTYWDQKAGEASVNQRGQRNLDYINQCEYLKSKEIFALLMTLIDETSGERVLIDEVGAPADQLMDNDEIVEILRRDTTEKEVD